MRVSTSIFVAASAAVASAQVSYNSTTGVFTCPIANGVYCAGDSLGTDIIIRCNNGVGQPGRCGDNLVGYPPLGNNPSLCYASPAEAGVAACAKNCVVYGSSGNINGDFTLPECTPYTTISSAVPTTTTTYSLPTLSTTITANHTTTTTTNAGGHNTTTTSIHPTQSTTEKPEPTTTTTYVNPTLPTTIKPEPTTTVTVTHCNGKTKFCNPTAPTTIIPTGGPTGGGGCNTCGGNGGGNGNGTTPAPTSSGTATATPVGPTTSIRPTFVPTNSGNSNAAGLGLAVLGLAFAFAL